MTIILCNVTQARWVTLYYYSKYVCIMDVRNANLRCISGPYQFEACLKHVYQSAAEKTFVSIGKFHGNDRTSDLRRYKKCLQGRPALIIDTHLNSSTHTQTIIMPPRAAPSRGQPLRGRSGGGRGRGSGAPRGGSRPPAQSSGVAGKLAGL